MSRNLMNNFNSRSCGNTSTLRTSGINPEVQALGLDALRGSGRTLRNVALAGGAAYFIADGIVSGMSAHERRAAKKAAKAARK